MANYWRSGEGRRVIEITARWLVEQAAFRGLTVHDYIEGRCGLTDIGITSENATATLRPKIEMSHVHYHLNGGGKQTYRTWPEWFRKCLRNRIFYFLHKHDSQGKIYRCVGEWSLPLPEWPPHSSLLPSNADQMQDAA